MLRTRIILFCVSFLFTSLATAEVTVNYLGGLDAFPTIDYVTSADAIFGSTGQPGGWVSDGYAYSNLGVATTFDPQGGGFSCGVGFTVEALHMVLVKRYEGTVQAHLNLAIGDAFLREDYAPTESCFSPTPCPVRSYNYNRYCNAESAVTFDDVGYYEVIFSGDMLDCDCIYTSYTHTIVSWLFNTEGLEFVTDDNSAHCPDHVAHTYFFGSCTWGEMEAPGNLLFWTEVSCCDLPVANRELNWGSLKSLYR